jgi:cytoskeleton protein RodZ
VETQHFGSFLKQRREARGLSIAALSRATKIKEVNLERLEDGRFDAFPAEVFVVGFVKAYAREVGLDPGEALQRYRVERGDTAEESPAPVEPCVVEEGAAALHGRRFGVALVVFLILIVATLTLSLLLRHGPPPGAMSGGAPSERSLHRGPARHALA